MTKLEAVNQILAAAGRHGASALQTGTNTAEGHAEAAINLETRKVSSDHFHYNTEIKDLTATDGEFLVPAGTIEIDTAEHDAHRDVVQRGDRLYDRENNTFTFTETTLRVKIVALYEFGCLPEPIAQYIALRAAYRFVVERENPNSPRLARIGQDLREQKGRAMQYDQSTSDRSLLDAPGARRLSDIHSGAFGLSRYGIV